MQVAASADNQMDLINGSSVCESRRFGSLQVCPFRCVLPHSSDFRETIVAAHQSVKGHKVISRQSTIT